MHPIDLPLLKKYEETLKIRKKLAYVLDFEVNTVQRRFDFENDSCLVCIPPLLLRDMDTHLSFLIFNLCLIKNTDLDPLFGVGILSKRYEDLPKHVQDDFGYDRHVWGNICTFLTKIWAIDLRHSYWPEFTKLDQIHTAAFLRNVIQEERVEILTSLPAMLSLAHAILEVERYHLEPFDFSYALEVLPKDFRTFIEGIVELTAFLPTLTGRKEIDIPMFQDWVINLVYCMQQERIHPRIITEDGMLKWTLGAPYS